MSITLSPNLQTIADFVPEGAKVLDVGCSKGQLMAWLAEHKEVDGRGVELCQDKVQRAIAEGLSVVQGDAETDVPFYQDDAYDVIILNQIVQQMRDPVALMTHAARIAERIIVSVPNFGYWRNRWYLAWHGKMPVTSQLDYQWYETPNIHFSTLRDFREFVTMLGLRVEAQRLLSHTALPEHLLANPWLGNLFAQQAVFMLGRQEAKHA